MEQLTQIASFILKNFLAIWPYLLVTIPISVAVNLSGASRYIRAALSARPFLAILLATLVGAFSPFCSCSVIPLVATLLIGGVPLAPVMSFWIASPSMDPETFFLSVGMLGWELAVWRLGATLVLSLGAGFATQLLVARGWLGADWLRAHRPPKVRSWRGWLNSAWERLRGQAAGIQSHLQQAINPQSELACCPDGYPQPAKISPVQFVSFSPNLAAAAELAGATCSTDDPEGCDCASGNCSLATESDASNPAHGDWRWDRLWEETWRAVVMVVQFMALAFFLEALIEFYVPSEWITTLLGNHNAWAIPAAALLGVPVYTSNLAALPLIGGLLGQGMSPAAALAFLVAGPATTLPAMSAVWGLVSRRVFAAYLAFVLGGALLAGLAYQIVLGL